MSNVYGCGNPGVCENCAIPCCNCPELRFPSLEKRALCYGCSMKIVKPLYEKLKEYFREE